MNWAKIKHWARVAYTWQPEDPRLANTILAAFVTLVTFAMVWAAL